MSAVTAEPAEHTYRYLAVSRAEARDGALALDLATSGGCAANPWLAEGFVAAPQPAARALMLVATVAGTRFWTPPNMVAAAIAAADPVVTASGDALRFESFSRCCGVYARFDLDAAAFDGSVHRHGTTNVDVNPPLRAALAKVGARDPLRLSIGHDEVAVSTLDGRVVERKVPLPERWVRGFAEVAVAMAGLEPVLELHGAGLRRFIDQLPTTSSRGAGWVVPSGTGARLASRPSTGAVAAGGVERLRALRELAPFVSSLTAFGEGAGPDRAAGSAATSVWCATIDGGRLTLALSPEPSRGFSGEGGLLHALSARADLGAGAAPSGPASADGAMHVEQAAAGRLGYDVAGAAWFPRDLPFDRSALDRPGGRLAAARQLVAAGAVHLDDAGTQATVTSSGAAEYRVRLVDGSWRCTCPWWAKHRDDRGPCKHILATVIASAPRPA